MIEKCGCRVTVDSKTQFETVVPCEKHDTWKRFMNAMPKILKTMTKRNNRTLQNR